VATAWPAALAVALRHRQSGKDQLVVERLEGTALGDEFLGDLGGLVGILGEKPLVEARRRKRLGGERRGGDQGDGARRDLEKPLGLAHGAFPPIRSGTRTQSMEASRDVGEA